MFTAKFPKWPLVLAASFLLAGCANFLSSNVVTFHEGPLPMGESIRVEPMDASKAGSLEFRSYARLIAEQLRKLGYTPVESPDSDVQLIAEVDYDIVLGPTDVRVERDMSYVRYHFYYGRFADPFYFGIDSDWDPEIYAVTNYERSLRMNIVRASGDRERLFEGRVQSVGRQNNLPGIMPYLITAMFANFPGESGVTKVVTIEMDE